MNSVKACLLALAPFALGAFAQADSHTEQRAMVDRLYAPFTQADVAPEADWDRLPAALQLRRAIDFWEMKNRRSGSDLSTFGWLCQCQDWDAANFTYTIVEFGPDHVVVDVDAGWGEEERTTIRFARDRTGGLVVANIFNASFPDGLKAALFDELGK